MNWFGFGFNWFGQIRVQPKGEFNKRGDGKVFTPVRLGGLCSCGGTETSAQNIKVVASWSRRANIHINGDVCVSGVVSVSGEGCSGHVPDEGRSGHVPDEGRSGHVPDEGRPGHVSDERRPGHVPDEGRPGHVSDEGRPGHVPDEGRPGHVPDEGRPGHVPDEGRPGHVPDEGRPGHVPDEGRPGHVPDEGRPGHVPDEGRPGHVPDEGRPGHVPDEGCSGHVPGSTGCEDAVISETHLALRFHDRVHCWSLKQTGPVLAWTGELGCSNPRPTVSFPLVPEGYIAAKPPFFRPLCPQLCAVSLALGTEHAVLLTASGTVYTWGSGSHGQLGHGSLVPEDEPTAVEALWGVPMKCVAAGGWHSACISAGGDLYVWGWNETGQVGLPSKGVKEESQKGESPGRDAPMSKNEDGDNNVFISIQAFPALVDISEVSEISKVSCGSRHTAVITSTGDLYTWGWGLYGQLGHGSECSSDEPKIVEYFSNGGMNVEDVVCGLWNTFVSVNPRECSPL
ncbi:uncharacterized protein rccd1 isoform X2 [Brachyhypopomus gauderio]|uniref:uncharacterized protein rccd1 isoform X2 n=1 Tax=Brachyhypopomus gauderio TaxID=698409 RepID=UPI00404386C2